MTWGENANRNRPPKVSNFVTQTHLPNFNQSSQNPSRVGTTPRRPPCDDKHKNIFEVRERNFIFVVRKNRKGLNLKVEKELAVGKLTRLQGEWGSQWQSNG